MKKRKDYEQKSPEKKAKVKEQKAKNKKRPNPSLSSTSLSFDQPVEKFDLVILFIDSKEKVCQTTIDTFLKDNKAYHGKPILIQHLKEFSFYGQSATGAWQLSHGLNTEKFGHLVFEIPDYFYKIQHEDLMKLLILMLHKTALLNDIKHRNMLEDPFTQELQRLTKKISKHETKLKSVYSEFKPFIVKPAVQTCLTSPKPLILRTAGGGDCALHALFGKWDEKQKQIVCADATQYRSQLAKIKVNQKAALDALIVDGIKEVVMSGVILGKSIQTLRTRYHDFLEEQADLSSQARSQFSSILHEHKEIIQFISEKNKLKN